MSFVYHSSCHSIQTMEHEYFECPEYLSNPRAEAERTEEFEYEVCIAYTIRPRRTGDTNAYMGFFL